MLENEGNLQEEEAVGIGDQSVEDEEEGANEGWASLETPMQVTVDPAEGLRPDGRFWDTALPSPATSPRSSSPSTTTLMIRAQEAGLSGADIAEALQSLADPNTRNQVMEEKMPASLDQHALKARKVVSVLFKQAPAAGSWKGPLPRRRRSPPMTMGDCLAKVGIQPEIESMVPARSPSSTEEDGFRFLNFELDPPL